MAAGACAAALAWGRARQPRPWWQAAPGHAPARCAGLGHARDRPLAVARCAAPLAPPFPNLASAPGLHLTQCASGPWGCRCLMSTRERPATFLAAAAPSCAAGGPAWRHPGRSACHGARRHAAPRRHASMERALKLRDAHLLARGCATSRPCSPRGRHRAGGSPRLAAPGQALPRVPSSARGFCDLLTRLFAEIECFCSTCTKHPPQTNHASA
jgi:hypothetical protein